MKTTVLIVFMCLISLSWAQTKEFKGTIEEYTCGDDRCSLGMKKETGEWFEENITLEYVDGKPTFAGQAQDLVISDPARAGEYVLNPKYQGKKVMLTCKKDGLKYYVTKMSVNDGKQTTGSNPKFPKATCKVYQNGILKAICEGGKYFEISATGEKRKEKLIQNKNEYCKGNKCIRITLNKEGYIIVYKLPNVTTNEYYGKIAGNKVNCVKNWNGKQEVQDLGITYKGDKNQAAMAVIIFDWFR